jgi:hypothetical protein
MKHGNQPTPEPGLPELCQCGELASRICEHGTKGCTVERRPVTQEEVDAALEPRVKGGKTGTSGVPVSPNDQQEQPR